MKKPTKEYRVQVVYTYEVDEGEEKPPMDTHIFSTKEARDAFLAGVDAGLKGDCTVEVI